MERQRIQAASKARRGICFQPHPSNLAICAACSPRCWFIVSPHTSSRDLGKQLLAGAGTGTTVRSTEGPDWLEGTWVSASWHLFLHLLKLSCCSSENVLVEWARFHCSSALYFGDFDGWKSAMGCRSCVANCLSGVCSWSFRQSPALRFYLSQRPPSYPITGSQVPTVRTEGALKSPAMPVSGRTCWFGLGMSRETGPSWDRRAPCTRCFRMLD